MLTLRVLRAKDVVSECVLLPEEQAGAPDVGVEAGGEVGLVQVVVTQRAAAPVQ